MNMRNEISRFDQKLHQLEHKAVFASEKLIHEEKFWVVVTASLIVLGMAMLAVLAWHSKTSFSPYEGPFRPLYPYGY
jgi:hypothetical protein